mmetsp:Transcript_12672/g.29661  ORF Transcript_12672/g.29661 Transcript_12672/m.29661 type:complete len:329 (+) Transcript_12672:161-1147(+)
MESPAIYQEDCDNLSFALSLTGLFGASITVLVTTLDDSIWLFPFVANGSYRPRRTLKVRLINACTFLVTLMILSFLCCISAWGLVRVWGNSYKSDEKSDIGARTSTEILEIQLEWISVVLCWTLASTFFVKKHLKKRRRLCQEKKQRDLVHVKEEEGLKAALHVTNNVGPSCRFSEGYVEAHDTCVTEDEMQPISYGSLRAPERDFEVLNHSLNKAASCEEEDSVEMDGFSPFTVATLTALGFLDEISYFPTLIIGKIFTVTELLLGTLLAGLTMLGIQFFLFRQCKPLVDFLDERVPLYAIIACFAVILTGHLMLDIRHTNATSLDI